MLFDIFLPLIRVQIYFNGASQKGLFRLLRILKAINVMRKLIRYKWIEFQVRPTGSKVD